MPKFLIASDSFKGTLTSFDIMGLFETASHEIFPGSSVVKVPVSDGGEGFLSSLFYLEQGTKISVETYDSNKKPIESYYYLDEEKRAYIECATCLSIARTEEKNPFLTTSYGIGILINDALKKGGKKIYLSLGGTSTNDFGIGMLCALGLKCFDEKGEEFLPSGGTLDKIRKIDATELNKRIAGVSFIGLCDVDSPLLGKKGCSLMFAKQKGTDKKGIQILENRMKVFKSFLLSENYPDYSLIPGAGAAGGIGDGILTFLDGKLESGIDFYLDRVSFDQKLQGVDVVFTGEGKIDGQTKEGKVISGIIKRAKEADIPVIAICGAADKDGEKMLGDGLDAIVTTGRNAIPWESLKRQAGVFYYASCKNALSLLKVGRDYLAKY